MTQQGGGSKALSTNLQAGNLHPAPSKARRHLPERLEVPRPSLPGATDTLFLAALPYGLQVCNTAGGFRLHGCCAPLPTLHALQLSPGGCSALLCPCSEPSGLTQEPHEGRGQTETLVPHMLPTAPAVHGKVGFLTAFDRW